MRTVMEPRFEPDRMNSTRGLHPGNGALRRAIRENVVSFPSQAPVLSKQARPEMEWRVALLFLVRGWAMTSIAARFDVPVSRISQMIREWSVRAFALGYIQVIDPDRFAELSNSRCDEDAPEERVSSEPAAAVIPPPVPTRLASEPLLTGNRLAETLD